MIRGMSERMSKLCYTTIAPACKKHCHRGHREHRGKYYYIFVYMVFNSVFSVNSVARVCLVFLHAFAPLRELFFMGGTSNMDGTSNG